MTLLLPLWLSCNGGAFKTFEDVFLSVWSITTVAAVVKRRVSGMFQAYSRLLPRCVHVHDWHHLWAGVIKCGYEADECWPSIL